MSSITHLGTTFNTTAGNKTVVATPAVGDLIVVILCCTGKAAGSTNITDNNGSGTYSLVGSSQTGFSTTGLLEVWIRDTFITSAVSTTFTANEASSTGGGLSVFKATSMLRTGVNALKQFVGDSGRTAASTPAPAFIAAVDTNNPVLAGVGCGTNSTTIVTPPASFTEAFDGGYNTPATGLETCFSNSGFTGTTLTWGSTVASAYADVAVELDTSALPGPTITAFETSDWTGTTATKTITVTGAAVGDLIVVEYGGDNFNAQVTAASVSTTSGSTDAWAELVEDFGPHSNSAWSSSAWTIARSTGSITLTLARTQSTGQVWGGHALLANNHGGIGNTVHLAGGSTETVTMTTSQDSTVMGLGIDWDDLSNVAFVPGGATDVERSSGTALAWYAGYWRAQAAGSRVYGIGTSSTTMFTFTAVEILAASGATAVGKDLSLVWDTRAAIGDTVTLNWDTRAVLGDEVALAWDVRAVIGFSVALAWDVRAVIGSSVALSWDIQSSITSIGKDLNLVWDVRSAVGDIVALVWDTRAVIGDSAVLIWDVRGTVADTLTLSWDVRSPTGANLALIWDVRTVIGDTLSLVWDVRATFGEDLSLLWSITGPMGKDLALLWDVQVIGASAIGKDLSLSWDVRSVLGDSVNLSWDVRSVLGDAVTIVWDTRALVSPQLQVLWDVRSVVGDPLSLQWDVRATIGDDLTSLWSILAAVGDDLTLVWLVESQIPFFQYYLAASVPDRWRLGPANDQVLQPRWSRSTPDRWRTEVTE